MAVQQSEGERVGGHSRARIPVRVSDTKPIKVSSASPTQLTFVEQLLCCASWPGVREGGSPRGMVKHTKVPQAGRPMHASLAVGLRGSRDPLDWGSR